jgi:hypothetical protein
MAIPANVRAPIQTKLRLKANTVPTASYPKVPLVG